MKKLYYVLLGISLFYTINCTQSPVLSEVLHSRLSLKMKGTYESNSPYPWNVNIYNNDYIANLPAPLNTTIPFEDIKFYIDFARVIISDQSVQQFKNLPKQSLSNFALNREILCSSVTTINNRLLRNCSNSDGINKLKNFFEEGFNYSNVSDLEIKKYNSISVLIRRMVIFPSKLYDNTLQETIQENIFDNERVQGKDIGEFYSLKTSDNPTEQESRFSPLYLQNTNININTHEQDTVIEVRIFFKNLLMKHVNQYGTETQRWESFVGPSDWLLDHAYDNNQSSPTNNQRLGGNTIIMARAYEPDIVGMLQITSFNTASCAPPGLSYFVLIPQEQKYTQTTFPLLATRINTNAQIINIQPGQYALYVTQDKQRYNATGIVDGQDGFPESFQLCQNNISIKEKETTATSATACTCP